MAPLVTMAITWILVAARFIIAVQLTRMGRQQKLPNLLWLAAFFYITGAGDIFFTVSPYTNLLWPFFLSVGLGEIMLVMFIHTTFYQSRKSPYLIFLAIALVFLAANVLSTVFAYWSPFNWIWLTVVGYQAYRRIAANPAVEDWSKARYKLVIAYSLVSLFPALYTIVWPIAMVVPAMADILFGPLGSVLTLLINVGSTTIGVVLAYLAWVMPERYRRYLNRNFQPPAPENARLEPAEEEVMRKLKAQA